MKFFNSYQSMKKNGKLNPDDTGNTIMAGFIKTVANARRKKIMRARTMALG